MRIDLITNEIVGRLYSEKSNVDFVYLKQMALLEFIKNYKYVLEENSFFDSDKGIVVFYRFKARQEKLFLEVLKKDIPEGVFND